MALLKGKKILIVGMLSKQSIAAGIAQAMFDEGAELAFTVQNEKFKGKIAQLTEKWNSERVLPCDVSSDEEIRHMIESLSSHWNTLDGIVHSVAFAPSDQLQGDYLDVVNREGFLTAHDISAYSFSALAKEALPMMEGQKGALISLSYLGAQRAIPNYNVMGLAKASLEANIRYMANSLGPRGHRVNGISAGPIKTLAASGIKHFKKMLAYHARVSPLRKNVDAMEVGRLAAFLCSDYASGITGEIINVDGGFSKVAMTDLITDE